MVQFDMSIVNGVLCGRDEDNILCIVKDLESIKKRFGSVEYIFEVHGLNQKQFPALYDVYDSIVWDFGYPVKYYKAKTTPRKHIYWGDDAKRELKFPVSAYIGILEFKDVFLCIAPVIPRSIIEAQEEATA